LLYKNQSKRIHQLVNKFSRLCKSLKMLNLKMSVFLMMIRNQENNSKVFSNPYNNSTHQQKIVCLSYQKRRFTLCILNLLVNNNKAAKNLKRNNLQFLKFHRKRQGLNYYKKKSKILKKRIWLRSFKFKIANLKNHRPCRNSLVVKNSV
jgi:hypothetical protein